MSATTQGQPALADLYCSDPVKACKLALRRTRDVAENDRLEAINALLGLHGTEAIRGDWQNGYWCDIVAAYCNTGDTYATTVIQVRGEYSFQSSRFIVSTIIGGLSHNSDVQPASAADADRLIQWLFDWKMRNGVQPDPRVAALVSAAAEATEHFSDDELEGSLRK